MDRDNQQQSVQETELAWLAGVLDCDGSVQITIPRATRARQHRVVNVWISFDNTDAFLINRIIDILDRLGIGHYDAEKNIRPCYGENGKVYLSEKKICLFCRISKMQHIQTLLGQLLPYLVGQKKALSQIILRFVGRRLKQGRTPYEEDDLIIVRDFFKERNGRFAARNVEILDAMLRDFTPNSAMR